MDVDALKYKIAIDYMEAIDLLIKGKFVNIEFIKQEIQVIKLDIKDKSIIEYYMSNPWKNMIQY